MPRGCSHNDAIVEFECLTCGYAKRRVERLTGTIKEEFDRSGLRWLGKIFYPGISRHKCNVPPAQRKVWISFRLEDI